MKRFCSLFMVLVSVLVISACGGGNEENEAIAKEDVSASKAAEGIDVPRDFTFASATVGGFWNTLSGSMSDDLQAIFPETSTTIVEGGSISNLIGLDNGMYALGFANASNVNEAYTGSGDFPKPVENTSLLATLYPNTLQIVVRDDSGIDSIEDLEGKKVSPGIKGYSAEITFQEVLAEYDMSYDDLGRIQYIGTSDAGDLMRDGHIDAVVSLLAAPVSAVQELDSTLGVKLLPLDQEVIDNLREKNSGYLEHVIPAGTYSNINEDIPSVASYTVLMAGNESLNEDAAYEMTKMLFENNDKYASLSSVMNDFDEEFSVENATSEFHPGAKKYYEEQGFDVE